MKRLIRYSIFFVLGNTMTGCVTSPQPAVYVYPPRGQHVEVSRDQAECQVWAKQQTGFDPTMDTVKGAGVGAAIGALGGAATGAAVGAATGNAGKGAAVGAAAGALGGAGIGAAVGYARSKEGYDNAYAVCMSGHGYAVAAQGVPAPPPPMVVAAPPPVIIQAPPQLVVVPGTPVYYAPGVNYNYFVYDGRHYVFHNGAWAYAATYNGPWISIALELVPQPILAVPVQYYRVPPGHWKKHGPPPWARHKKDKDD